MGFAADAGVFRRRPQGKLDLPEFLTPRRQRPMDGRRRTRPGACASERKGQQPAPSLDRGRESLRRLAVSLVGESPRLLKAQHFLIVPRAHRSDRPKMLVGKRKRSCALVRPTLRLSSIERVGRVFGKSLVQGGARWIRQSPFRFSGPQFDDHVSHGSLQCSSARCVSAYPVAPRFGVMA